MIVVIQDIETQFDSPFYTYFEHLSQSKVVVFYTQQESFAQTMVDSEVRFSPKWDNLNIKSENSVYGKSIFYIWRMVVSLKPEHIIISGWYPRAHLLLAILFRVSGLQIGVRADSSLVHFDNKGWCSRLKLVALGAWLSFYDFWHPVGSLSRRFFLEVSWVKRPIAYFPYAVDVDWFATLADKYQNDRARIREQMGIGTDCYVVLGVMKWSEREDPLTLVEAYFRVLKKIPNATLILVGDGPLRGLIEKTFSRNKVRLFSPGFVSYSQLPLYYSIADIFVHPALSEPYGVSIQEALACGLPVLASNMVGSAADFIKSDLNGDIFQAGDFEGLADLLILYEGRIGEKSISFEARDSAEAWSYRRTALEIQKCLA